MLMLGLLGDQTYTVRGVQSLFGLWTYTSAPDLILTYIIVACQQKKKVQNHDQGNKKNKRTYRLDTGVLQRGQYHLFLDFLLLFSRTWLMH